MRPRDRGGSVPGAVALACGVLPQRSLVCPSQARTRCFGERMGGESPLKTLITERRLRQLASARSFERGEQYYRDGHVSSLAERGAVVSATVRGTEDYQVRLEAVGGELRHRCTCPLGGGGEFCKHAVAVALAWLHGQSQDDPSPAIWLASRGSNDHLLRIACFNA